MAYLATPLLAISQIGRDVVIASKEAPSKENQETRSFEFDRIHERHSVVRFSLLIFEIIITTVQSENDYPFLDNANMCRPESQ
ncbi:MAG: hypothetical protein MZU97_19210 [Bacillus subtilis]|nr:hypothetical protein [Bacillus subtilis]